MRKNRLKKSIALLLACISLFALWGNVLSVNVRAAEIAPYYDIVTTANCTASAPSGKLTAAATYSGSTNKVSKVVITMYVEKKTAGLFWSKIDLGTTNNQWVDTLYKAAASCSHSVQLPSKGTYRVTAVFTVYGKDGSSEEITKRATVEY